MKQRKLGNSGLYISELVFGTWFPDRFNGDQDRVTSCVREAIDSGITAFDTADSYLGTWSERALALALAGVQRPSIELMTKVYWPVGRGANDRGLSRKHIKESIDASLRRLNTDYVDVYQAHRYDYECPLEETMLAFADVVRSGKALYIGLSEWNAHEIREASQLARELQVPLISNQPQYSMLWRIIESEVVPTCDELGIGQIAWSPLAQGVLSGKYLSERSMPAGSRGVGGEGHGVFMDGWLRDSVLSRVQRLKPLAAASGLTLSQLAIAWVLNRPSVCGVVMGASRPEQVRENALASGVVLEPEVMVGIDEILRGVIIDDAALTTSPNPRP